MLLSNPCKGGIFFEMDIPCKAVLRRYIPAAPASAFCCQNGSARRLVVYFALCGLLGRSAADCGPKPRHHLCGSPACSSSEALSGSSSSSPSADSSPADPEPLAEGEVLSVPLLSQQQLGMPTGCELVSAGMLLEYYGCDLTLYQWMDNCVEFSTPWLQDGRMVNLSPGEAFIGSPWESSGYGCFAPVIRDALALALPDRQVEDLTGTSLEELEREYLSRRIPVLVWVTICMEETSEGPSWLTPEGETFTRTNNEHCMVLVGSDSDNYIFNDPYQAGGQVSYPRQLAESRYEEMGRQAVAVTG